jgi:hypothetical protein
LFVGASIISANAKVAVSDVHVFGCIVGRFADNVWARCRGRFGAFKKSAAELLARPLFQDLRGSATPFGDGHSDVFPVGTKVQVYGRVVGWRGKVAFGDEKNVLELFVNVFNALPFARA